MASMRDTGKLTRQSICAAHGFPIDMMEKGCNEMKTTGAENP